MDQQTSIRPKPIATRERRIKAFSAGVVPVYLKPTSPLYLLLRCYHYWDFPKGGVQGEETPLQAALRELEEETTLTDPQFIWGEQFRETPIYANGKVARYYVAKVERLDISLPVNPLLGRPEHQEFRWVDYDEAKRLVNPRVLEILDWARSQIS